MNRVTEIVKMQIVDQCSKEAFIGIVNDLEVQFHAKQPGYVDTELLFDEKETCWIMIQHWECMEDLKAASGKMFKETSTEVFRGVLQMEKTKISIYPQLCTWSL